MFQDLKYDKAIANNNNNVMHKLFTLLCTVSKIDLCAMFTKQENEKWTQHA
jgi:hypothetical protein